MLYSALCNQYFLNTVLCDFTTHHVYKTTMSPTSGEKRKAIILEMGFKITAQW